MFDALKIIVVTKTIDISGYYEYRYKYSVNYFLTSMTILFLFI